MSLAWPQTMKVNDSEEILTIKGHDKDIKGTRYSFDWILNKFTSCNPGINKGVRSTTFWLGEDNELEAYLVLYPNGIENENIDNISVFLQFTSLSSVDQQALNAKVKFTLVAYRVYDSIAKEIVFEWETFTPGLGWGFPNFAMKSAIQNNIGLYLPNGALTIRCEIVLLTDKNFSNITVLQSYLLDSVASLYKREQFTDVIFTIYGTKLRAHKAILAARSDVFRAMFESDMCEARTSIVNITDASVELFEDFLLFVYTGKVACLDMLSAQLLVIADKYAMQDLKTISEESLVRNLSVDDAAHLFVLSDSVRATRLKQQALMFIRKHRQEVKETEGWKDAKRDHPRIMAEASLEY